MHSLENENDLSFYFKRLEKEQQIKPKGNIKKVIIKTKKINYMESKYTTEKSTKPKVCFLKILINLISFVWQEK